MYAVGYLGVRPRGEMRLERERTREEGLREREGEKGLPEVR